jgi:hypothetical protein
MILELLCRFRVSQKEVNGNRKIICYSDESCVASTAINIRESFIKKETWVLPY